MLIAKLFAKIFKMSQKQIIMVKLLFVLSEGEKQKTTIESISYCCYCLSSNLKIYLDLLKDLDLSYPWASFPVSKYQFILINKNTKIMCLLMGGRCLLVSIESVCLKCHFLLLVKWNTKWEVKFFSKVF